MTLRKDDWTLQLAILFGRLFKKLYVCDMKQELLMCWTVTSCILTQCWNWGLREPFSDVNSIWWIMGIGYVISLCVSIMLQYVQCRTLGISSVSSFSIVINVHNASSCSAINMLLSGHGLFRFFFTRLADYIAPIGPTLVTGIHALHIDWSGWSRVETQKFINWTNQLHDITI